MPRPTTRSRRSCARSKQRSTAATAERRRPPDGFRAVLADARAAGSPPLPEAAPVRGSSRPTRRSGRCAGDRPIPAPEAPSARGGRVSSARWTAGPSRSRATTRSEEADAKVKELEAGGYPAYEVTALVKGVTWYRVRIAGYVSQEVAYEAIPIARAGARHAWSGRGEGAVRRVDKPWGTRRDLGRDRPAMRGRCCSCEAGRRLSLQHHERKEETLRVQSGELELELDDDRASSKRAGSGPATAGTSPPDGDIGSPRSPTSSSARSARPSSTTWCATRTTTGAPDAP